MRIIETPSLFLYRRSSIYQSSTDSEIAENIKDTDFYRDLYVLNSLETEVEGSKYEVDIWADQAEIQYKHLQLYIFVFLQFYEDYQMKFYSYKKRWKTDFRSKSYYDV